MPQVGDLSSIDNQYLFYLALNYGLIASALLVAILLWTPILAVAARALAASGTIRKLPCCLPCWACIS